MSDGLTIKKLLDNDRLKQLADKIVSEDIDGIIIIYRDKKDNTIVYDTTINFYPTLIGCMDMASELIKSDWWNSNDDINNKE